MNKTAWKIGESIDKDGKQVDTYLWVYSAQHGLVVSDEYPFHEDLCRAEGITGIDKEKSYRGLVIVYPDTNTADVLSYTGGKFWSHDEGGFIPDTVWEDLEDAFKGTRLEEKQGLEDAILQERHEDLPIPTVRQKTLAGWNNYLLYPKAGGLKLKSWEYPPLLADAKAIADYIETISTRYVASELIEEFFHGCHAVLRELPIDSLKEGSPDINMPVPSKERKYKNLSMDTLPPLVVDNGVIQDGNHRYRAAKSNRLKSVWCYVVME